MSIFKKELSNNANGLNVSGDTNTFASASKSGRVFSPRTLTFCAISIALAYISSTYLELFKMPWGGSVTLLSMFFICFVGYVYGPYVGIVSGLCLGLIQLMVNPYVIHPIQLVLDYFLAFGCLGIAGFFHNKKHGMVIGYIVGVCGRYVCSVLSGWIFFSEYAWKGWNTLAYSLAYNATYIFAEAIITIVVICIIRKPLYEIKKSALSVN